MHRHEDNRNRRPSAKSYKSNAGTSLASDDVMHSLSVPSLNSQFTDVSNTSFTELVTVNNEGHPYIDINRLMYKPTNHPSRPDSEENKKERMSMYIPDFAFIVFNLSSLCISTYFCLIGTTTLTWKASVGMFSIPACWELYNGTSYVTPHREEDFYYVPCKRFTKEAGAEFTLQKGYNFFVPNTFPVLRTKLTDAHYFGLVLICIEIINVVNVIVGINACLQGYKGILIMHITVDSMIVIGEFVICAIVAFTSVCDSRDLMAIREVLKNYVHWYGIIGDESDDDTNKDKPFVEELDALQINLGCCGVDGWADYMAIRFPQDNWARAKGQVDESEVVIPFSCCKPWWIRNIYCSHGVHVWSHPLATVEEANRFEERIVQEGCMYKLEKLCLNLRDWMGAFGFIATAIHFGVIIVETVAALVLIRNINNLIRKNKQIMRRKEMMHEAGDSDLDLGSVGGKSLMSTRDGKSQWGKVPPPTEDEIITIKQRSNFNNFMSRVKGGLVGKWMRHAQNVVTEGHKKEDEATTEDQKKHREKELLHNKAKSVRDHDEGDKGKRAKLKNRESKERYLFTNFPDEMSDTIEEIPAAPPHKKVKRKTKILWKRKTPEETDMPPTTTYEEARRKRKKKKQEEEEEVPWFKNW